MAERERAYDAQMTWMDTAEQAGRLRAWADARGMKHAPLMRIVMAHGLRALEPIWEQEAGGALAPEFLAEHIANARLAASSK